MILWDKIVIHIITEMCDGVTDRGGGPGRRPRESHLGQSAERDGRRNTETGAATLRRGTKFQSNARRGPKSFSQWSTLLFIEQFL